jgi:kynurenine formamidase
MKRLKIVGAVAAALSFAAFGAQAADVNDAPLTEKWAPTEWGPDDKIGAVNRLTPAMVLKHAKLIKTGRTATLGKVYQSDAPFFGSRGFNLTIPGLPTGGPFGSHKLVYNDEMVTTEIGQVGTQFDGPGHIGVITSKGEFFYNGAILSEVASALGMGRLGVEHVADKGYVCRGVLLNAAKHRGMAQLPIPKGGSADDPGIITAADLDAMTKAQGVDPIGEGDCVFLYTGHGHIWHPNKWDTFKADDKKARVAKFNSGEPGFGISACNLMTERKIVLTGADSWAVEAVPGENVDKPFECHMQMQTRNGIWNLENMDLTKLIDDNVSEFLFVWAPLKIKGGTGSPGNPIAIY